MGKPPITAVEEYSMTCLPWRLLSFKKFRVRVRLWKKTFNGSRLVVKNIYAGFKRHDLGPNYWERNFDGTLTKEFMTEPLWGVGTIAPYGHDGRSIDLWSAIIRHGGKAQKARDRFARLSDERQGQVVDFLQRLVLFPPDDTASNLNPGDSQAQNGHGNIALPALFNKPSDLE